MIQRVLSLAVAAGCLSVAAATPESSRLFRPFVDPESGVVSYLLKPDLVGHNQQSIYFTAKSMTDDGRFLLLDVACDESLPLEKRAWGGKRKALVDFKKDEIFMLGKDTSSEIPCLDTERDQLYYFRFAPHGERRKDMLCRRDLLVDPMKEIEVCPMPKELTCGITNFSSYSTHPTLTRDRKRLFIGYNIDGKFGQGCINLETGAWESWGVSDFHADHDQINPVDDRIAMVAWECCWTGEGKEYQNRTGWYPRMWFAYPDGRRELIPARERNFASHEIWDDDGGGITWCGHGVWHMDLRTRKQTCVVDFQDNARHAMQSPDLKYCVFDVEVDKWWRGSPWKVCFVNNVTKRHVWIYSASAALTPKGTDSHLHPDPHPQFVCRGKYIVSTFNDRPWRMTVCVTPVAPLVERTTAVRPPKLAEKRVDLWPAGGMPDVQATQKVVPYVEFDEPERVTTDAIAIIAPGGGYRGWADSVEGVPLRNYLLERGMRTATLRYRTPRPEPSLPKHLSAWQDAQRAVRIVRSQAVARGYSPDRIGFVGFSAGGHLTLMAATSSLTPAYKPVDALDKVSCSVNWAVPVYPAYVLRDGADCVNQHGGNNLEADTLVPEFKIDKATPPMCFFHGDADSHVAMGSVRMYHALRVHRIPAELHVFAGEGHVFFRGAPQDLPAARWKDRLWEWLSRMGLAYAE